MRFKHLCVFIGSMLVTSGCMYVPVGSITMLTPTLTGVPVPTDTLKVTKVTLHPSVIAGGYSTQAVVNPYGVGDINHLVVKVFTVSGNTETPVYDAQSLQIFKDIPNASLNLPVVFDNLKMNTTYRFRAYAYSDLATASLISSDASSTVDVPVGLDDRPNLASLQVQLINKLFNGQATASNIVVTTGSVVHSGYVSVH